MRDATRLYAVAAPGETGENRGMSRMVCPVCREVYREGNLTTYYKEIDEEYSVEICCDCAQNFETDSGQLLTSDMLATPQFMELWNWCLENSESIPDVDERIYQCTELSQWCSGNGFEEEATLLNRVSMMLLNRNHGKADDQPSEA